MGEWDAFDKWPEDTCCCRCGAVFLSHARVGPDGRPMSRNPCPKCGCATPNSFSARSATANGSKE